MITKLIYNNIKKTFYKYLIYFIILTMSISIFYMFNSLYGQDQTFAAILSNTSVFEAFILLKNFLFIASVIGAIILLFLTIYANMFFIKQRYREFAIYAVLGMGNKQITLIIIIETVVTALLALIIGLVIGIVGSQFILLFTLNVFELDMSYYHLLISIETIVITIGYYLIIILILLVVNILKIRKLNFTQTLKSIEINTFKISKMPSFIFTTISLIIIHLYLYLSKLYIAPNYIYYINENLLFIVLLIGFYLLCYLSSKICNKELVMRLNYYHIISILLSSLLVFNSTHFNILVILIMLINIKNTKANLFVLLAAFLILLSLNHYYVSRFLIIIVNYGLVFYYNKFSKTNFNINDVKIKVCYFNCFHLMLCYLLVFYFNDNIAIKTIFIITIAISYIYHQARNIVYVHLPLTIKYLTIILFGVAITYLFNNNYTYYKLSKITVLILLLIITRYYYIISNYLLRKQIRLINLFNKIYDLILFLFSIGFLIKAYRLLSKTTVVEYNLIFNKVNIGLILVLTGSLLFFMSLRFIVDLLKCFNNSYYDNLNLFIINNLSLKLKKNYLIQFIICLLLSVTILISVFTATIQPILYQSQLDSTPYDASAIKYYATDDLKDNSIWDKLDRNLNNPKYIKNHNEILTYVSNSHTYFDVLPYGLNDISIQDQYLPFISLSQYNELMDEMNKTRLSLTNNQYFVLYDYYEYEEHANNFIEYDIPIMIHNNDLHPRKSTEKVVLSNVKYNMAFVIPDQYINDLVLRSIRLNINNYDEKTALEYLNLDYRYNGSTSGGDKLYYYDVVYKIDELREYYQIRSITSMITLYIQIVLMLACLVILVLNQIVDNIYNKKQYLLLHKLGVDKKVLSRSLFWQNLFYCSFPLLLAIINTNIILVAINLFNTYFMDVTVDNKIMYPIVVLSAIYIVYFIMNYHKSKAIIKKLK